MTSPRKFWEELFDIQPDNPGNVRVEMRLLRKQGRPFLLLPLQPCAAAEALQLYPAQTPRARAAKAGLRLALKASLSVGTEAVSFSVAADDPLVRFLGSVSGTGRLPAFGILAGNPASDGQRFLLLAFDAAQQPVAVVKAGLSERARTLIGQEESVLRALEGKITGVPRIRGMCESSRLRAMALDYFPGRSPRRRQEGWIPPVLSSWVDQNRQITLRETADWKRLEAASAANDSLLPSLRRLRDWTLHPAIQHGDFAPWNVRVSSSGTVTVLDWERGELTGIPAWDWFHYVVQPPMLVERLQPQHVAQRVEELFRRPAFQQYAALTGINGCERELALAYLLHAVEVIKPSEGLDATRQLFAALLARWSMA